MKKPYLFLSIDDAIQIHSDTINSEGGLPGLRDRGLLDSAITMAQQQFAGQYLHKDLASMAGAYIFHVCKNHPFYDGNKRCAAMCGLIFLDINGARKLPGPKALEKAVVKVASGSMSKDELIEFLRLAI